MSLFLLAECGIKENWKGECGMVRGRREAGRWLFSWKEAGIIDFFRREAGWKMMEISKQHMVTLIILVYFWDMGHLDILRLYRGGWHVGSVSSRECLDAPAILATFTAGRTGLGGARILPRKFQEAFL